MAPQRRTAGLGRTHERREGSPPPAQRLAIETYAVHAFVVTNANLTGAAQAERLISNLNRIARFAEHIQARTSVA
jgi:hypothetical protein